MHQEHNIPWNKLASNFKFVHDNPEFTPQSAGFFVRNLPSQGKDLNHFTRVLTNTITNFAQTERKKYATSFDVPHSGLLFADELRDRYPHYLNGRNQRIQTWIDEARRDGSYIYDTGHGHLADVVKILINENEMPSLLMLAQHPQIPLSNLLHLSWGHHFGFSRVAESALDAYLLLNLIAATGTLQSGEYLESVKFSHMVRDLTLSMDHPAQQLPHIAYLDTLNKDARTSLPEIHSEIPRLHEYLKTLFSLLYRYDMVLRECGVDSNWEMEILTCFQRMIVSGKLNIQTSWTENGGYLYQFI